jgi:hypothetical protein
MDIGVGLAKRIQAYGRNEQGILINRQVAYQYRGTVLQLIGAYHTAFTAAFLLFGVVFLVLLFLLVSFLQLLGWVFWVCRSFPPIRSDF